MLWTLIRHGQVSNTDIDEICTMAWLAVWLMLLNILCCRVHNFRVILNSVVLYSPLVQVRFVAIGKLQDVSNSWLAILLHFHRLCLCYGHWAFSFFFSFPKHTYEEAEKGFDETLAKEKGMNRDDRIHGALLILNELVRISSMEGEVSKWTRGGLQLLAANLLINSR